MHSPNRSLKRRQILDKSACVSSISHIDANACILSASTVPACFQPTVFITCGKPTRSSIRTVNQVRTIYVTNLVFSGSYITYSIKNLILVIRYNYFINKWLHNKYIPFLRWLLRSLRLFHAVGTKKWKRCFQICFTAPFSLWKKLLTCVEHILNTDCAKYPNGSG